MEKESNSIGLLLVSALAGIGIGMLLAPDKGSDTRRKLVNKTRNFASQMRPVKFVKHVRKEKKEHEAFLSNVHSQSNPVSA